MTNVKEFSATEGFLNLGEMVTKCQKKETYEDCLTKEHLELAARQCNCTPFNIMNLQDNPVMQRNIFVSFAHLNYHYQFSEYMLASWIGMLQNATNRISTQKLSATMSRSIFRCYSR